MLEAGPDLLVCDPHTVSEHYGLEVMYRADMRDVKGLFGEFL